MIHNNNDFPLTSNSQFVLSLEVLCLLKWLIEHDADKLKKIIAKAVDTGLAQEIQKITNSDGTIRIDVEMQQNIIDFFGLLEVCLVEALHEQLEQRAREKNLMPAIDQIDLTLCDDATVQFSLKKATSNLEHNPNVNPREQLFKELLKRWKPHNKNNMH